MSSLTWGSVGASAQACLQRSSRSHIRDHEEPARPTSAATAGTQDAYAKGLGTDSARCAGSDCAGGYSQPRLEPLYKGLRVRGPSHSGDIRARFSNPWIHNLSTTAYQLPLGPKLRTQPPSSGALCWATRPRRAGILDSQHTQRLVPRKGVRVGLRRGGSMASPCCSLAPASGHVRAREAAGVTSLICATRA